MKLKFRDVLQHNRLPGHTLSAMLFSSLLVYSAGSYADGGDGSKLTAPLKDGVPYVFVVHKGRSIKVERDIDQSFQARPNMRGTLRHNAEACPPFCLQPMQLDMPVRTVGEVEVIDFMQTRMRDKKGVLVDVRGEREYRYATIPGSIHLFIGKFKKDADDPEFVALLKSLGATPRGDVDWITRQLEALAVKDVSLLSKDWDFSNAMDLIVWSNGPLDSISVDAIHALVEAGYPAQKIGWYRGGMPAWQFWGFNTVKSLKRRR
ncbi:rhodanese-like domain-containing protein [Thiogranum longum]|nr:rhodanese-like domain-containing protein [Thiogranum longum]